ncbi:MAG: hypothetical protein ACKVUS_07895 [Saprospiraceae bacterium]
MTALPSFLRTKKAKIILAIIVLQNAFIQALRPAIENKISLASIKDESKKQGFFKDLFDGDDGDKKKKKKKDRKKPKKDG